MSSKSQKTMLKSASIERGRCYARVFTRVLEWKGKKHSPFMPFGVIELRTMCLKEFRKAPRKWKTPRRACCDIGASIAAGRSRAFGALAFACDRAALAEYLRSRE